MINTKKGMFVYLALGLILGSSLDLLRHFEVANVFFPTVIVLFCLFYGLCFNEENNLRLVITSVGLAVLLSLPLIPLNQYAQYTIGDLANNKAQGLSLLAIFPLFAYVGHSFHYGYHYDNNWRITYPTLFSAVWDSFVLLIAATIFFYIAKLLILLAALLFKTVNINALWDLYFNNFNVYVLVDSVLFFLGLGVAQQNHKIIHDLRFLLLKMMHFLLPLLAIITVIYFILYLIAETQGVIYQFVPPELLIGCLVVFGIIFFNAYFQTGNEYTASPLWLTLLLQVYRLVLFCLCAILCYRLVKFYQFPINLGFWLLTALLYCAWYANTAFLSAENQRRHVTKGNIVISLFFLIGIFLLNNPIYPIKMYIGMAHTMQTPTIFGPGPVLIPQSPPIQNEPAAVTQQLTTIDKELQSLNLAWKKNPSTQSFVAGYRSKKPIFICRAQHLNGYHIGSFYNNQCTISYAGQAFEMNDYVILTANNKTTATWTSYPSTAPMIGLGVEPTMQGIRVLYACRVQLNGQPYIGKLVDKFCDIAQDTKELPLPVQDVLVNAPSNPQ